MSIFLPTVWSILLYVFYSLYKQLKRELQLLPSPDRTTEVITHPIIGKSVMDKLVNDYAPPYSILLIASEQCSYCLQELNELLVENKPYGLPIVTVVLADDEEASRSGRSKYDSFREEISLMNVEEETLKELDIYQFPTLLLIDHRGMVLEASGWNRALFVHYQHLLKGGEDDAK